MAIRGDLRDMSVSDLIQHYCQEGRTAELIIKQDDQQAGLYFKDGNVRHAQLGRENGEEVVYRLLTWRYGEFALENGVEPPSVTINRAWSSLLLEGARRLDEEKNQQPTTNGDKSMATQKKSEQIAAALTELLRESSDITGAAVVGVDGLVYSANVPSKDMDEAMVGAVSAAVLGLSKRSAVQLKRGSFKQTLIQADDGNIVVAPINDETLFVGLSAANVNLGMAFAEVRNMTDRLKKII